MHRCSESVGSIATALAKAQTELTNPEKSMVGTIHHNNRGDNPQTFRYAPLSGGLEIVRRVLGGQQIAVAQTTAVDRVNGLINLTTVLMHTSGEWISSDWPVCALSEASAPRRMGAALTYARRYALFTLVGIAGEDDLDAPDTGFIDLGPADVAVIPPTGINPRRAHTGLMPDRLGKQGTALTKESLGTEESASIRVRLEAEINEFISTEDLQARAIEILKAKNRLMSDDAKLLEASFAAKLAVLNELAPDPIASAACAANDLPSTNQTTADSTKPSQLPKRRGRLAKNRTNDQPTAGSRPHTEMTGAPNTFSPSIVTPINPPKITTYESRKVRLTMADLRPQKIDKSKLTFGEVRRRRDKTHLRFVALQPCLICGRVPSDAHHLRFAQPRAMGRKTSDEFTVPLCRSHHRDNHKFGDEAAWWGRAAIEPIGIALKFWKISRNVSPD